MSTLIKTKGIVLNHHFYGESSAIVHVYTRALGRQSYIVNGIKGQKKNKKTPLLQPLNRLLMEVYNSPKKDLQRIREFTLEHPLRNIPFSQGSRAQAFFITEILSKVLTIQEPSHGLYDFLDTAIDLLDSHIDGHENLHLFILFQLSRLLGFQPMNNISESNRWFDLQNGHFTSSEPAHPLFLTPEKAIIFARLFTSEISTLKHLARNVKEREILLNTLLDFFRLHTPGLETVRSIKVLHDILHP